MQKIGGTSKEYYGIFESGLWFYFISLRDSFFLIEAPSQGPFLYFEKILSRSRERTLGMRLMSPLRVSYRSMTSRFPPFLNFFLASGLLLRKSMASRFASIRDEEVKEFKEKLENENTKKKPLYDIKVFKEYIDACDEKRDITPVELQEKKLKITVADDSSQSQ